MWLIGAHKVKDTEVLFPFVMIIFVVAFVVDLLVIVTVLKDGLTYILLLCTDSPL